VVTQQSEGTHATGHQPLLRGTCARSIALAERVKPAALAPCHDIDTTSPLDLPALIDWQRGVLGIQAS
jgi:hypothetical protein